MSTPTERKLLPAWAIPLLQVAVVALTVLRPSVPLRLALTLIFANYVYVLLMHHSTGDGAVHDSTIGGVIGNAAYSVVVYAWLCDPVKDWHYRGEKAPSGTHISFANKVYKVTCVIVNTRLIGWNNEVPNVPPATASRSHGEFLRHRLLRVLQCLLYIDLAQSYVHLQPLFSFQGTDAFPTGWKGVLLQFLCLFAWFVNVYATMKLLHTAVAIVCVATGLFNGNPEDWRPAFGNWSDAYTLRRFWGRTWHQFMRVLFRATGQTLASAFGGSWASSQTQLYAAFFASGLIHTACDAMVGKEYIGTRMKFFMANAVAITFEDAVIGTARRLGTGREGPARWMKCIGYMWVAVWFYHACQPEMHYILPLGAAEEKVLPFSLVRLYAPAFV
ncbi:hypothetical protein VTO73DRAFT_9990 [Trametes versicolor]